MKKVLIAALALVLVVGITGVLTVADAPEQPGTPDSEVVEVVYDPTEGDIPGTCNITTDVEDIEKLLIVKPPAFPEGTYDAKVDTKNVAVCVDPIHVGQG